MAKVVKPPERVEAELVIRSMSSGRNGALLMQARAEDGAPVTCVVKLAAGMAKEHASMLPIPYLCEWLGSAIGAALGVATPRPFEVVVTKEFGEAITDLAIRAVVLGSTGSAFGSEHLSAGLTQYTRELPDPCLRTPAAELVAYDVFIHNPDRRVVNPNLLIGRGDLLAIDHGDAFSFLLTIIGAPDPVTDALEKVVADHACRPWLHKREFSLDVFRASLEGLTDDVLRQIAEATPSAWQTGPAGGKLSYVVDVMKKRRDAVGEWLPRVEAWLAK